MDGVEAQPPNASSARHTSATRASVVFIVFPLLVMPLKSVAPCRAAPRAASSTKERCNQTSDESALRCHADESNSTVFRGGRVGRVQRLAVAFADRGESSVGDLV